MPPTLRSSDKLAARKLPVPKNSASEADPVCVPKKGCVPEVPFREAILLPLPMARFPMYPVHVLEGAVALGAILDLLPELELVDGGLVWKDHPTVHCPATFMVRR